MDIREAARRWAQGCIDDWAHESLYELNEVLDTEFTEDEVRQIGVLASMCTATLPEQA